MSKLRKWWVISVSGYGSFDYFGFEHEAEEMRAHKADWEGGRGTKRLANSKEIEDFQAATRRLTVNSSWDRISPRVQGCFTDAYNGSIPDEIIQEMKRVRYEYYKESIEDDENLAHVCTFKDGFSAK